MENLIAQPEKALPPSEVIEAVVATDRSPSGGSLHRDAWCYKGFSDAPAAVEPFQLLFHDIGHLRESFTLLMKGPKYADLTTTIITRTWIPDTSELAVMSPLSCLPFQYTQTISSREIQC